jgi:hypothetical protein
MDVPALSLAAALKLCNLIPACTPDVTVHEYYKFVYTRKDFLCVSFADPMFRFSAALFGYTLASYKLDENIVLSAISYARRRD